MASRGILLRPFELIQLGVRDPLVGRRFQTDRLELSEATYEIVHVGPKGVVVQRV